MEYQIKNKISMPRYQQIAVEIATRIANEEYKVGDKIYTRSYIAGHYGVSPETARRAICVLSDLDIVVSEKEAALPLNRDRTPPTLSNNLISVKPLKVSKKKYSKVLTTKNKRWRH